MISCFLIVKSVRACEGQAAYNMESASWREKRETHRRRLVKQLEDAESAGKYGGKQGAAFFVTDPLERFTLFVVLPTEEIVTLRDICSGKKVFEIKAELELSAGIPGQVFTLHYPSGNDLEDDAALVPGKNIRNGTILRIRMFSSWDGLFYAVRTNNIEEVVYAGGIQLLNDSTFPVKDAPEIQRIVEERAFVAIFIASYRGHVEMVKLLLHTGMHISLHV